MKEVYGWSLEAEPCTYIDEADAHNLTLRSGEYGIRFETDGGKVSSFYVDTFEAIQYIEECP